MANDLQLRNMPSDLREILASIKRIEQRLGTSQATTQTAAEKRREDFDKRVERLSALREMGSNTLEQSLGLLTPALEEAKRFNQEANRIAVLNLGDQVPNETVAQAKTMQVYGASTTDNLRAVRQALAAFGDISQAKLAAPTMAKLQVANQALYGKDEGAAKSAQFTAMLPVIAARGGLKDEAGFNEQADAIQKILANTQGRVAAPEWLKVLDKGGQAARGLNADAFFNRLEPLVQQLGGEKVGDGLSASYRNLYQGTTTAAAASKLQSLGLVDPGRVKTNGTHATLDAGALKGSDLFAQDQAAWLQQVLLPALKAKGITGDRQTLDAIRSILPDQAGAELFTQLYQQHDQLDKSAAKTRGTAGIDGLFTQAQQSPEGAELNLQARKADLYRQMGDTILPTYVKALEIVAQVLEKVNGWLQDNPTAGGFLITLATGASLLSATFGALATGLVGIITPFLMVRGVLGMAGAALSGTLGALSSLGSGALGVVSTGLQGLSNLGVRALPLLTGSLEALGSIGSGALSIVATGLRFLLALPLGPVVAGAAAVAGVGALVYTNWDKVVGIWGELKKSASSGWEKLKNAVGPQADTKTSPISLLADRASGGADNNTLLTKLKTGKGFTAAVAMGTAAASLPGIAAPLPISERPPLTSLAPAKLVSGVDTTLPQLASAQRLAGSNILTTTTATAPLPGIGAPLTIDSSPPLTSPAATAPAGNDLFNITINAPANANPQEIATLVRNEIAREKADQAARNRSSLRDWN
ncbi:hypothetical protein [Pseudomonas oryzihabitans]|uniref:hypothetical protein n=1 Tax=Pseudomonas oryzihabitans TaxID=47885 RepID=UPI00112158C0|nr:hypothetical protein [Pseudomonas psychrotolerans]QDD91312.1 hypothetical protein CCZ28_20765 [Pseudomonas psychrotolerans]